MHHQHHAARPIVTTIRMSATRFDLTSIDLTKPEGDPKRRYEVSLAYASSYQKEDLAATLCQLHGIGTAKQFVALERANARAHAEAREAWRAKRLAKKSAKAEAERAAATEDVPRKKRKRHRRRRGNGASVERHAPHTPSMSV